MLTLVLVSALNLAPGITLADHAAAYPDGFTGRVRLVADEEDDGDKRPSLDAMTRTQLARELKRLEDARPSFAGPIVAMAIGYPLLIAGLAVAFVGFGSFAISSSSTLAIVGFLLVGVGAIMGVAGFIVALIGTIKLATRFGARRASAEEIDEVQRKIDELDQRPVVQPLPPPDIAPPPPPPLPPEANLVRPGPMMTLATF